MIRMATYWAPSVSQAPRLNRISLSPVPLQVNDESENANTSGDLGHGGDLFAIGVAEFIVVGVLPAIAQDLHVSLAAAGKLVGLYALALAIGTPLAVLGLARLARKTVLLSLITLFTAGNILSSLADSYPLLLAGRAITAVAHGSFFAIGATVASRLAPRARRTSDCPDVFRPDVSHGDRRPAGQPDR